MICLIWYINYEIQLINLTYQPLTLRPSDRSTLGTETTLATYSKFRDILFSSMMVALNLWISE